MHSIADECADELLLRQSGRPYELRKNYAGNYKKTGSVNNFSYWLKGDKGLWVDTNGNWCFNEKKHLGKAYCAFFAHGSCPNGLKWKYYDDGWKDAGNEVEVKKMT